MSTPYCNVALPVPLRTTFTYAVPEALRGQVLPGSRVLAPFRKKSLVGVVVEMVETPTEGTKIREISKLLDLLPALTPKLIELGHWIAGYYLAPIGEVFRAMLPPVTDLSLRREMVLTEAGRTLVADLQVGKTLTDLSTQQVDFLRKLSEKKGLALLGSYAKLGVAPEDLQRLQRRGFLEIRESMQGRKRKTQRIVAWKGPQDTSAQLGEKEERVRLLLTTERGPLPLAKLLKLADVSRTVVERMLRDSLLESWEERDRSGGRPIRRRIHPPAHALNEAQESAFSADSFTLRAWGIRCAASARRHRQRKNGGVPAQRAGGVGARKNRAGAGARNRVDLVDRAAVPRMVWRAFEGVAVLHSALSDVERAREWWRVRNGQARVVVGTRSAIFAPVENLGLIIVDEEQENSYKQEETPRYHGRDVAIVRAKMESAAALLGSATPSLETYHNAMNGKYELLTHCDPRGKPLARFRGDRRLAPGFSADLSD